jgi:hypothetical protein
MRQIGRLAWATLRFVAALIIGVGLVVVAQFSLLFFGEAQRFSGFVLWFGTVAAVALALRYAISGKLTRFDRAAASAATAITASGLFALMTIAGLAVVGLAALSALFMIGGGADTAKNYFVPMMSQASIVLWLALLAVAGLGYAIFRVWRKA